MTVAAGASDDTRWNAAPSPGPRTALHCTGSDHSTRTVVQCLVARQDTARTEQDLGCAEQLEPLAEPGPAAEQQQQQQREQQQQEQQQQQPASPGPNPTTLSRQPSSAGSGLLPRSLSFTFGALSPLGSPAKPPGFSAPAASSPRAAAVGDGTAQWASPTGTPLLPALPPQAASSAAAPATAASAAAQSPLPRSFARSMRLTGSVRLLGDQVLPLPPKASSSSSSPQAPAQAASLPQLPAGLRPAIRQLPFAGSLGALGTALQGLESVLAREPSLRDLLQPGPAAAAQLPQQQPQQAAACVVQAPTLQQPNGPQSEQQEQGQQQDQQQQAAAAAPVAPAELPGTQPAAAAASRHCSPAAAGSPQLKRLRLASPAWRHKRASSRDLSGTSSPAGASPRSTAQRSTAQQGREASPLVASPRKRARKSAPARAACDSLAGELCLPGCPQAISGGACTSSSG